MQVEDYKENNKADDEVSIEKLLKPELSMDSIGKIAIDNRDIIKRSVKYILNAPKEELYHLLFNGFLIDKGEKV